MKFMQTAAVISFFVAVGLGPATAHQQGKKLHLADAPPDQQVEAINYCQGVYRVVTKRGGQSSTPSSIFASRPILRRMELSREPQS
jgi:hypothetical protein